MNAKPTKSPKCCFCETPIKGEKVSGFCKKLIDRFACRPCADNYYARRDAFLAHLKAPRKLQPAIDVEKLTQSAQQNSLFAEEPYSTIRMGNCEWKVTASAPGYRARLRLKDNLELCACTHKAKRHVDDGEGNLLACRDCDCDHFWYAVPQPHRGTHLIVLSDAIQQSAELDKIAKLRGITRENGATAEEEATALRRIVELMSRETVQQQAA
jgi:hypothetical protein